MGDVGWLGLPKPGQNFVIQAGYYFFLTGWVTGCLFLQRDPAQVQAVQKIVTRVDPCTDPIITLL